jgi:uncharacterized protein with PQ loop repeat
MWCDALGYVGTVFIVAGYLMRKEILIKSLCAVGAAIFLGYGILIHSYPVIVINVICLLIAGFEVIRIWRKK